ncbi:Uma2 family endonuclease [Streptomyces odontomachi]|uniref:Uma2 family endonuclease n=1 Tax=Streptomyces odontomachi TaxID=2944940 RepID=UPI00210A196F|nr:Uma2 family endonuclease [Streptomyces sp. ODS25]
MSALPVEPFVQVDPWAALAHLDHDPALDSWRAELIEGQISLTPPPVPEHERIVTGFTKQLARHDTDDELTYWSGGSGLRTGNGTGVKPDILVTDDDAFCDTDAEYNPADGEPIHLVVEVTSASTRDKDYREKMRAYAAARIPHYLIIDRQERICRLYSLVDGAEAYGPPQAKADFGEPLRLPAPLNFSLDTSRFA